MVMDILRVLSSPDLEVRKKTLSLALELVSSRNVEEMVMYLRKVRTFASTEQYVRSMYVNKYVLYERKNICCLAETGCVL